jgi:hypothetical protein
MRCAIPPSIGCSLPVEYAPSHPRVRKIIHAKALSGKSPLSRLAQFFGRNLPFIPPAMTHRVDRERSIFGTELEDPKWSLGEGRGGDGGVCRKRDPRSAVEAQSTLGAWGLKRLKRRVGCGGRGPENSSQVALFYHSFTGA